jgi:hypothetical protein
MELEASHVDFWEADSAVEWGSQDLTEVWYKGVLVWSKPAALRTFTRQDHLAADPAWEGTATTEVDGSARVAFWGDPTNLYYFAVYVASGGHWFKLNSGNWLSVDGMTGTIDGQFCVTFNYPGCDRTVVNNDKAVAFNQSGDYLIFDQNPNEMNVGTILDIGWPRGMTCRDVIGFTAFDPNATPPDGPDGNGVYINEHP